jgi:preprotein translocase subunit YajC
LIDIAYAMGTGAGGVGGAGGGLSALMPLILMFVIFYFLLIRPQQKKAKEHREMVGSLKKGDRVITSGGLYGTITSVDDTAVTLEVAEKVRVKVMRGNISSMNQPPAATAKKK